MCYAGHLAQPFRDLPGADRALPQDLWRPAFSKRPQIDDGRRDLPGAGAAFDHELAGVEHLGRYVSGLDRIGPPERLALVTASGPGRFIYISPREAG